jgi:hypothetical protein
MNFVNQKDSNMAAKNKKKKNNEPLKIEEIEPYHGYQTGTNTPCIHCGKRYVLVDIVQIPKDKSNDGTGFVNIITCECGRVVNGAECRDVLNAADTSGKDGRTLLSLDVLIKTMEHDYNGDIIDIYKFGT